MLIERPYRQKRTATFSVNADPDAVFSLMCPVREYEWAPGWTTNLILSESGLIEEGCIFTTPGGASAGSSEKSPEAIWVTPVHHLTARRLMMIKVTPAETVTRLDIAVDEGEGAARVTASYEHTALSDVGCAVVDQHTEENFAKMMQGWAAVIEAHFARKAVQERR